MKILVCTVALAFVFYSQLGESSAAEPATKRPQTAGDRRKCDNPTELNNAEVKCEEEVKAGGNSKVFQRMRTCVLTEIGVMRDEEIVESAAKDYHTKFTGDEQRIGEIKTSINNCFNQKDPERKKNCVNENIRRSCVRDRTSLNTDKPAGRK